MFRFTKSVLVAASALCATTVIASAQTKIAIINLQNAIVNTAEIKKAQAQLEAKYKPRQEALINLQKEVESIQQQLQTMQGKLTPQAEQELSLQGQRKQHEYQRMGEDLQADVDRDRGDAVTSAGRRFEGIVKKIADAKGIDLVIDISNTVYFKQALDITKECIAAFDQAYPVK